MRADVEMRLTASEEGYGSMKPSQARRIRSAFTFHPPKNDDQRERYEEIRSRHGELATYLAERCPDSRELNSALKCLEESMS